VLRVRKDHAGGAGTTARHAGRACCGGTCGACKAFSRTDARSPRRWAPRLPWAPAANRYRSRPGPSTSWAEDEATAADETHERAATRRRRRSAGRGAPHSCPLRTTTRLSLGAIWSSVGRRRARCGRGSRADACPGATLASPASIEVVALPPGDTISAQWLPGHRPKRGGLRALIRLAWICESRTCRSRRLSAASAASDASISWCASRRQAPLIAAAALPAAGAPRLLSRCAERSTNTRTGGLARRQANPTTTGATPASGTATIGPRATTSSRARSSTSTACARRWLSCCGQCPASTVARAG
jgi:hypothetical protein